LYQLNDLCEYKREYYSNNTKSNKKDQYRLHESPFVKMFGNVKENYEKLVKTKEKIKTDAVLLKTLESKIKNKILFNVDTTNNIKIKRPAIELPFMNDGDHIVNQQEND